MKRRPGEVRDAIVSYLARTPSGATAKEIHREISQQLGNTPSSSVRSYLRLNTPDAFTRSERGRYELRENTALEYRAPQPSQSPKEFKFGAAVLQLADCLPWLEMQPANSVHAVVTDPPYGLLEYSDQEQAKLRNRRGGVWRIPPSFDGSKRAPLPRFTVLKKNDIEQLHDFFLVWGRALLAPLVPGANVIVAGNPLLSYVVSTALARAGLERRGEIARLVMTMRGGDRPKAAHEEFKGVSVMPRSMWEPWLVFRKPIEGRVQDNLRKWGTGGFRRPSGLRPFGDVIQSAPTHSSERKLAPHPSLKPQLFLRQLVRAALPLGKGVVLDPFAGSGSTLAAAEAVGYRSLGVERDPQYFELAQNAIPKLAAYKRDANYALSL